MLFGRLAELDSHILASALFMSNAKAVDYGFKSGKQINLVNVGLKGFVWECDLSKERLLRFSRIRTMQ
ncbi:protein of unknown function [Candidatus Methylomirabilis oxygeniifera]|uniref:Uncharacterized protein n=1 Tax=Methylomirabilis oxygeniifera TaxID=671143 RepID=D5MF67_METO1|nr:protein of unknown function [Candidatus Methylomirabilis oxyfera]